MASVCEVCGKKPSWGMSVSHSHRRTKRRWNPNIQRVRALVDGTRRSGSTSAPAASSPARSSRRPSPSPLDPRLTAPAVQGVVKAYDPVTGDGVVICDTDLADYDLAADALAGSVLRMLRQGQRVIFDLDDAGRATAAAPRLRGRHGDARPSLSGRSAVCVAPATAGTPLGHTSTESEHR